VEVLPRCCAGDAAVAETDATDAGAGVLVRRFPAVASLDLKCSCFNALTDEGMRAVSSLTALTPLDLWGCSKVMERGSAAASLGSRALPSLLDRRCGLEGAAHTWRLVVTPSALRLEAKAGCCGPSSLSRHSSDLRSSVSDEPSSP
jgi:hypothetical protein